MKQWVGSLKASELGKVMEYASMKGVVSRKRLGPVPMHVFNHHTHHRGQATTLLFQAEQWQAPPAHHFSTKARSIT